VGGTADVNHARLGAEILASADDIHSEESTHIAAEVLKYTVQEIKDFLDNDDVQGPDLIEQIHAGQAITAKFVRKHGEDRSKPGMLRKLTPSAGRMIKKLKEVCPLLALCVFVGEMRPPPPPHSLD